MPTYFDGKLVFIHIPKCAGKSVRESLMKCQEHLCPELGTDALVYRWHESLFEVQNMFYGRWGKEKWDQATVISVIRHPVERAVSWWKYNKSAELENHRMRNQSGSRKVVFRVMSSYHPLITPEDHRKHENKREWCIHEKNNSEFEKFNGHSIDEYVRQMTIWKVSGCSSPSCPYHGLAPQVSWLLDRQNTLDVNKLNLFLFERLEELTRFLPKLGQIGVVKEPFEKGKNEDDYIKHLTTESLLALKKLYAEDFKLYEILKSRPTNYYEQLLRP